MLDPIQILTRDEFKQVLAYLHAHRRSKNTRQNGIIFRLAACCGLRVSEIAGLRLFNVLLDAGNAKPHIQVPSALGKGQKARKVPLWWDAGTLESLMLWKAHRITKANGNSFVCQQQGTGAGKPMSIRNCQNRYAQLMIKVLGPERGRIVMGAHKGRHFYGSACLYAGRSIIAVRDAMGHSSIATTSLYAHLMQDDNETVGNTFSF